MSRSYVNLADVTTKCLLNGEIQFLVCVIELEYGLCPAFGKCWEKKVVVKRDSKLLSLLFLIKVSVS